MRLIKPDRRYSLGLDRACHGSLCGVGVGAGFGASRWTPSTDRAYLGLWYYPEYGSNVIDAGAPGNSYQTLANAGTIANENLSNATKANQPGQTTLNGIAAPLFVQANKPQLATDSSYKTGLRFLHDGTGCTLSIALKWANAPNNNFIICDRKPAGVGAGMSIAGGTGNTLSFALSNASANIYVFTSAGSYFNTSGVYVLTYRYSETASPKVDLRVNGSSVSSGAPTGSPAAGADPYIQLGLGWNPNTSSANFFDGVIAEVIAETRYCTDAQVLVIESYLRRRWGD